MIGVCYFPEHWSREEWREDVATMAETGIEYVRMGEFAWSRYEPTPGEYDFEWLAAAVDLVAEHGMEAVLCTPTAAPPKWLVDEHPGMLQEEADGTVRNFGGRRHYCYNSPAYRRESDRIVSAMADRFAGHDAVAGWQTDNEYGTVRCYCSDCAAAFRDWLRERYADVDALNEAWGNAFWSQEYTAFDEIDPPRHAPASHHPSRLLDFYRFSSDSVVEYNRRQVERLRAADDDWFVTHNFMSFFGALDAYDVCEDLDFAAWDSYPTGHVQLAAGEATDDELRAGNPDQVSLNHALYRGAADGPFWIMEQQPGGVNWPPHPIQPGEGAMRLWAHHAVAHGADVVSYFRWRRCRMGQEQYHAGLRTGTGEPDRGHGDARRAAGELAALAGADGGGGDGREFTAPVALLHDYENLWGLDIEPASVDFDYWAHLRAYYRALRRRGVAVDVLPADAALGAYDAVVAPTQYFAGEGLADRLTGVAEAGGDVLVTIRSGVKNGHNRLRARRPGPLADLVGTAVDQYEGFRGDATPQVEYGGDRYRYRTWGEWLAPDDAEAVGSHATGVAAGEPAITRHAVGPGTARYVGVWPGEELADALVGDLLESAGIDRTGPLPDGIRVVARGDHTRVVNFTGEPVAATVPADATWRLGGDVIEPYGLGVTDAPVGDVSVSRPEDRD